MKRLIYAALMLILVAGAYSCGSSRKSKSPAGLIEDLAPLTGAKYRSDADYFRAVQNGVSPEKSVAQKIAMQNCRQELAANIQAELRIVIENYLNVQRTSSRSNSEAQYQDLAYTVVKQKIVDVQVVEEKMYREESNGYYRYYVCLQLPKASLEKAFEEAVSKNETLNLEFDRTEFKKIFDSMMAQ